MKLPSSFLPFFLFLSLAALLLLISQLSFAVTYSIERGVDAPNKTSQLFSYVNSGLRG